MKSQAIDRGHPGVGSLDASEPAGRATVTMSCTDMDAACFAVALDCVDGPSCVAFADPGACMCALDTCMSPVTNCQ